MKQFFPLLFLLMPCFLSAQGTLLSPGHPAHHIMDRMTIKGFGNPDLHLEIQPYWRQDLRLSDSTEVRLLSAQNYWDYEYLRADNNFIFPEDQEQEIYEEAPREDSTTIWIGGDRIDQAPMQRPSYYHFKKPLLKYFYRSPAYFFEIDRPFFSFRINPVLDVSLGRDPEYDGLLFNNRRGIEFQGGVDDKVFFYSNILETQSVFVNYLEDRIQRDNAIPGAGTYKYPRSSHIFNTDLAYDYLVSEAYIGFNVTRHVGVQLGHGRNFIGNGYRSLLLSDYGANYFFLKLNWRVWKFHFQNVFAELSLESGRDQSGDKLIPKKYMAAHYLSFRPSEKFSIGFFESVVFSRINQFEFQYLNPVILYRTVEQFLGSPDNVLIGLNAHWNLLDRFQLYGQLMLDEFKFDELILENRKWWGNKYGAQLGLKYIDAFGVDHLDLQAEWNLVRPYTYTHRDSSAAYTHYNQPLAHPNGANFQEALFRFRYRPFVKWEVLGRVIFNNFGEDTNDENWGSDILTPSSQDRLVEDGVVIGQGIAGESLLAGLELRYYFWHNMSLELEYLYRSKTSADPALDQQTNYVGFSLRINPLRRYNDF